MLKRNLPGVGFLAVWLLLVLLFWTLMAPSDALGYSILAIYLVLPAGALIAGFFYGRRLCPAALWFILFAALLGILLPWLTFDRANTVSTGNLNAPELFPALLGGIPAGLGLGLGSLTRRGSN